MSLSGAEQRVCEVIRGKADLLLEDLRLHVGIPTGRGNQAGLDETRQRLTERLKALGASVELRPGDAKPKWLDAGGTPPVTAICRRVVESGGPSVLIAGHLDTVHDPQSSFRELTLASDGSTATGPGCVDMKGGLVIALAALESLAEAGASYSWTVLLNSDEETGSYHSFTALQDEARQHDFGIALEPALANGELAIERMGAGQFLVEVFGKSAHVGRAFADGISAVTRLGECLVRIGTMPDLSRGRILNVGPISGGGATNAVPEYASARGNVRYPDRDVADEIEAMLRELETEGEDLPNVRVTTSFNRPAKPKTEPVETYAAIARQGAEDLGQQLPFASTGGVCDGNIMQDAGLPTLDTLGVRGGGLHTEDEWIEIPSLVERCQLFAVLMMRIAEGRGVGN